MTRECAAERSTWRGQTRRPWLQAGSRGEPRSRRQERLHVPVRLVEQTAKELRRKLPLVNRQPVRRKAEPPLYKPLRFALSNKPIIAQQRRRIRREKLRP